MGRGAGKFNGHFPASHLRASGCGDEKGSGTVLPRLVSGLDTLAELAVERVGDWRLRPGRGARQRRGSESAFSYTALLGGVDYWTGRVAAIGPSAIRNADNRSRRAATG